jgi:hypothetical protein
VPRGSLQFELSRRFAGCPVPTFAREQNDQSKRRSQSQITDRSVSRAFAAGSTVRTNTKRPSQRSPARARCDLSDTGAGWDSSRAGHTTRDRAAGRVLERPFAWQAKCSGDACLARREREPRTDECSPGAFVHLKTDDAFRKKLLGGRHIRSHCPIDFTEDMAFRAR